MKCANLKNTKNIRNTYFHPVTQSGNTYFLLTNHHITPLILSKFLPKQSQESVYNTSSTEQLRF